MELFEKKVRSRTIFKGQILSLYLDEVKLSNGKIASREKVTHPGAVGVIPVDKNGGIILVEQFRYPIEKKTLEIPAGKLDKGELPLDCAVRELEEEIGAVGPTMIHLSTFYTTPGFSNEVLHLYLAKDFTRKDNKLDDDEFLEIIEMDLEDSVALIESGGIRDSKTIIGILLARDHLKGIYKGEKRK